MAGQAGLVGGCCCKLRRIANVGSIGGLGMFQRRTMAGLAGLVFVAALHVAVDYVMRSLAERVIDIFVADLTGRGTSKGSCDISRSPQCTRESTNQNRLEDSINIGHAPCRPH